MFQGEEKVVGEEEGREGGREPYLLDVYSLSASRVRFPVSLQGCCFQKAVTGVSVLRFFVVVCFWSGDEKMAIAGTSGRVPVMTVLLNNLRTSGKPLNISGPQFPQVR